jgi:acetyltransferase
VLDFLAADGATQSILVYMEGIRHARRFMSALRAAAYAKPVVVMKAGRQPAGTRAALTHSAAIVGSDDVFDAALRRAGVVRVRVFTQLFSAAKCLASRFRPVGKRLAIVTNGGGPGVLAADWADEVGPGGRAGEEAARRAVAQLPAGVATDGVIDLGEDASGEHYNLALKACLTDRKVDGVLLIHSPKQPAATRRPWRSAVAESFSPTGKPLLGCWMGEATVRDSRAHLNELLMPSFRTPEAAVDAFNSIASFYRNQQLLQQTPPPLSDLAKPDTEGARLLIEGVLAERRRVLTEMESKALLAAFHIPVTRTMLARTPRGHAHRQPAGLPGGAEDRLARHQPQERCARRGAQRQQRGAGARPVTTTCSTPCTRPCPRPINGVTIQPMAGQRAAARSTSASPPTTLSARSSPSVPAAP